MRPGDLVRINIDKNRNKVPLTLWKDPEEGTENRGAIHTNDIVLVLARYPSLMGIPGTDTDHVMLLVSGRIGWNTAHWFKKIQDGRDHVKSPHGAQAGDAIKDA